ncbi:hypothetical protein G6L13_09850 [Agrobacterium tumefaciens]|uniref:hypothetical protein n=1 Tax=Agrobacterium tumefaciens TaxID=358 RepID=UPI000DD3B59C|nr:hypothetical protein [Agrobacterium tumefaciens]NTA80788.1 hypothetical protein [Agrobacterium tumefaciens]
MTVIPQTQRDLFESAVVERMKESGFLEVEIRVECLARCDDGYQDEVINAGWHYWNAALSADSGDEEQPRYTTRRLHEEIRKAEERGRQEERECTTSPSDYYKRAAVLLENLRDEIGSGFGEGDIELIGDVVIARLRAWDKLDREDVKRRLSAPSAPSVAVKALEWNPYRAETPFGWYEVNDQRDVPERDLKGRPPFLLCGSRLDYSRHATLEEAKATAQADYEARILSALSAQVQDVAGLLDETWNAAVEQAAAIANDCVHLTPDPGTAIRTMLNGRTKLHPAAPAKQEG